MSMISAAPRRGKPSPMAFPVRVPFVDSLGIELHAYGEGHAELWVDLDAAHLNTWDVAHGGVVMTMLDVAMALAARGGSDHTGGVATIEMKTSFLRPAEHRLRALGKVLHKTATLCFCEASLFDDRGRLCASATGTFKYLRGLPARGRVSTPQFPNDVNPAEAAVPLKGQQA
jgi:uncharacterized protein (TIGR00369 family)